MLRVMEEESNICLLYAETKMEARFRADILESLSLYSLWIANCHL